MGVGQDNPTPTLGQGGGAANEVLRALDRSTWLVLVWPIQVIFDSWQLFYIPSWMWVGN